MKFLSLVLTVFLLPLTAPAFAQCAPELGEEDFVTLSECIDKTNPRNGVWFESYSHDASGNFIGADARIRIVIKKDGQLYCSPIDNGPYQHDPARFSRFQTTPSGAKVLRLDASLDREDFFGGDHTEWRMDANIDLPSGKGQVSVSFTKTSNPNLKNFHLDLSCN